MLGKGGLLGNTAALNALRDQEQLSVTSGRMTTAANRSSLGGVAPYGAKAATTGDGGQLDVEVPRRPLPGKKFTLD